VAAFAQAQSQARRGPVFKRELPNVNLENWEVTVSYVDDAPGRVAQPPRHIGFVLAYVLEGPASGQKSLRGSTAASRCRLRRSLKTSFPPIRPALSNVNSRPLIAMHRSDSVHSLKTPVNARKIFVRNPCNSVRKDSRSPALRIKPFSKRKCIDERLKLARFAHPAHAVVRMACGAHAVV
jgi:hypothetical protein